MKIKLNVNELNAILTNLVAKVEFIFREGSNLERFTMS